MRHHKKTQKQKFVPGKALLINVLKATKQLERGLVVEADKRAGYDAGTIDKCLKRLKSVDNLKSIEIYHDFVESNFERLIAVGSTLEETPDKPSKDIEAESSPDASYIRAFTMSFNQSLREDLPDDIKEHIQNKRNDTIEQASDYSIQFSLLIRKLMLHFANATYTMDEDGEVSFESATGFDITDILPAGFQIEGEAISVAPPLNKDLLSSATHVKNLKSLYKDTFFNDIQSKYFGVQGARKTSHSVIFETLTEGVPPEDYNSPCDTLVMKLRLAQYVTNHKNMCHEASQKNSKAKVCSWKSTTYKRAREYAGESSAKRKRPDQDTNLRMYSNLEVEFEQQLLRKIRNCYDAGTIDKCLKRLKSVDNLKSIEIYHDFVESNFERLIAVGSTLEETPDKPSKDIEAESSPDASYIRAFTMSFNQSLREDLPDDIKEHIKNKRNDTIEQASDYSIHFSLLIRKLMLHFANATYTMDEDGEVSFESATGFDITDILPAGFQIEGEAISVAPSLNKDLLSSATHVKNLKSLYKDTFFNDIQSKYFGVQGARKTSHSVIFETLTEGVPPEDYNSPCDTLVMKLRLAQYVTNHKNMWSDNKRIYKLLSKDKVLNIYNYNSSVIESRQRATEQQYAAFCLFFSLTYIKHLCSMYKLDFNNVIYLLPGSVSLRVLGMKKRQTSTVTPSS
ncbi:hypothetical protein K501DRAFT_272604 [Backusella circina FSU 941]|nr:hypothetical protein K501DRAFT_272604 [Backusella circina FSU 941]